MNSFELPQASELLAQLSTFTGISQPQMSQLILALGGVLILGLFLSGYRKTRRLNQKLERLQHELQIANSSAMGMGQQLLSLEKKILRQNQVNNHVHQHQQALEQEAHKLQTGQYQQDPHQQNPQQQKSHPNVTAITPKSLDSLLEQPQEQPTTSNSLRDMPDDNTQAYDQARQWLAQGYDVSHVIKKSGLSQAEVSLMYALQKNNNSATDNVHRI